MARILAAIVCALAWLFILRVLKRADLRFWHFIWGALGVFILAMVFVRPVVTQPLAQCVAALAGIAGSLTDTFAAYFRYGIIYVPAADSSITLQVDMECSGVIETFAFIALLAFFDVYKRPEKLAVGVVGVLGILVANALRIILICEIVHFCGVDAYGLAHTFVGRLFFYALTILLYFYVFTKPHVVSMKVGGFLYGNDSNPA